MHSRGRHREGRHPEDRERFPLRFRATTSRGAQRWSSVCRTSFQCTSSGARSVIATIFQAHFLLLGVATFFLLDSGHACNELL
jgi:hypothetical protein